MARRLKIFGVLTLAVCALGACTGGAAPNDVAEAMAAQDRANLEARRAALSGAPIAALPGDATAPPVTPALPPPVIVPLPGSRGGA